MKVEQFEANRRKLKYENLLCGECYAAITGKGTHTIVMKCERNGHYFLVQLKNGITLDFPEKYEYFEVNANLTYSF